MKYSIITLTFAALMVGRAAAQLVSYGYCSKLENKCIIDDGRVFDCDNECTEDAGECRMETVFNGMTNTQLTYC
ncbi:hypothetical protein LIA77_05162 [Sarocladium implicatum]|nr:hypothetical protein LIA77_05162 [Sarocladium implicatum]